MDIVRRVMGTGRMIRFVPGHCKKLVYATAVERGWEQEVKSRSQYRLPRKFGVLRHPGCGVWHELALGHFRLKQRTLPPVHLRFAPKGDIRSLVRKMVVMGQFLPHAPTAKKATFCSRHTREVVHRYADW